MAILYDNYHTIKLMNAKYCGLFDIRHASTEPKKYYGTKFGVSILIVLIVLTPVHCTKNEVFR